MQVTAFRWPTKSISQDHVFFSTSIGLSMISIIWAVGPPLFEACADTRY